MGDERVIKLTRYLAAVALTFGATGCAFLTRSTVDENGNTPTDTSVSSLFVPSMTPDGRFSVIISGAELSTNDHNNASDVYVRDHALNTTRRISLSMTGGDPNGDSYAGAITPDGRYVSWVSNADNTVVNNATKSFEVFLTDTQTSSTELVSVALDGSPSHGDSYAGTVSTDGRYVLFHSNADDLVANDTNNAWDVFVRDRVAHTTERVSVTNAGDQATADSSMGSTGSMSPDARYVFFSSADDALVAGDGNGFSDAFVRDRQAGTTSLLSKRADGSQWDSDVYVGPVTPDGRRVVLLPGSDDPSSGDTNGFSDSYLRDRTSNTTTRLTLAGDGSQPDADAYVMSISNDGRFVTFNSTATNLAGPTAATGATDSFVRDLSSGLVWYAVTGGFNGPTTVDGAASNAMISGDGRYVSFSTGSWLTEPNSRFTVEQYLRSTFLPSVTGVAPTAAARGASSSIDLTGEYLIPGAFVSMGPGITVTNVSVVDEHHATVSFTVAADAPLGAHLVWFTNPGTGPGIFTGGTTIAASQLTVS